MPYLTATNDYTQDKPTRTYAVTLAFAHTSKHLLTRMYVHSRTTVAHLRSCAHTHSSCVQPRICTRSRMCTLTCEYKFMHRHTQPHTRAGIYAQSVTYFRTHTHTVSCVHAHSFTHEQLLRTLVHTQSSTHTRECTLVHARS